MSVTIECPWCEQDEPLDVLAMTEPEAIFACPDCGTSIRFVDEAPIALDLAA